MGKLVMKMISIKAKGKTYLPLYLCLCLLLLALALALVFLLLLLPFLLLHVRLLLPPLRQTPTLPPPLPPLPRRFLPLCRVRSLHI